MNETTIDPAKLQAALDNVHHAGMPGLFAEVRDGDQVWRGAAGVADLETGRPVNVDMRHRVGSVNKTFVAAAVLQLVENGQIGLDTPIGHYLPRLVSGQRGEAITVRMLLNHTSGFPEYLPYAYPSLKGFSSLADARPDSLVDHQFTVFHPTELIELGVTAPAAGEPGSTPGTYSNTNYQLLDQLLEHVTGTTAEKCITRDVIERAGLRDTHFPAGTHIDGDHSLMYEPWLGMFDPPREFSVYDMSYAGTTASLISTVADLNRFFGLLFAGEIVSESSLEQMRHIVPIISQFGQPMDYGLGLYPTQIPGVGTFWGHAGTVWGAGATALISADGQRQLSFAVNMQRWNRLDAAGTPQPHPIDGALAVFQQLALGGNDNPTSRR